MSPSAGPRAVLLIRSLWLALAIPAVAGAVVGLRLGAQSISAARLAPSEQVAPVPIADFGRTCAPHLAASDRVLLLDAGFGLGVSTGDGYDDADVAAFAYTTLPAHVLVAPDVSSAQTLLRTEHPHFLAIWLPHDKPETRALGIPDYASEAQASSSFELVATYTDAAGDKGMLFSVQQS